LRKGQRSGICTFSDRYSLDFECVEDSIPFTRSIKTVPLAPVGYPLVNTETADLLRKHGGKTGEELKAEGK